MDLTRYTLSTYMRIVTYKTAYYSFYLPVACGLLMGGAGQPEALELAKSICVEMGQYFQVRVVLSCLLPGSGHCNRTSFDSLPGDTPMCSYGKRACTNLGSGSGSGSG